MTRIRHYVGRSAALVVAAAAALTLGLGSTPAEAFPFPSPVYSILAVSGTHTASLLNLPLGQPGIPQVPMPVDVDGDLLPDVTVSVNLLNVGNVLANPPNPAAILEPNVQIDRLLTTPLLGQSNPPLRIEAKLRLIDLGGSGPDTNIRFGYETGAGGSIPPTFKATLGGLPQLFNPLSAVVDLGPSAGRPISYEGPLRLVGGIQTGGTQVDLGFGFSPFPSQLAMTYFDDAAGQHLTYAHSAPREVDLRADVDLINPESELHVDAKIERLPGQIAVDIAEGGSDSGAITWASDSDGRRPDVDVHLESIDRTGAAKPLVADIDLESLPQDISAAWSLPEDGPMDVVFDAGGQGIGGVDIDIRDHLPDAPGALPRFVPTEQQFLSVLQAPGPDNSVLSRISGRVERVHHAEFSNSGGDRGVLDAQVTMGDGELPLQVSYDCRVECSADGTLLAADIDATVSPLPDDFGFTMTEAGETDPLAEPMVITYEASEPTDVEASLRLVGAAGTVDAACGALATTCADLSLRDLPTTISATLTQAETDTESTMAVDLELGDGSLPPDLEGTVIIGPSEPDERPTVAEVRALHLPDDASVFVHQTVDPETGLPKLDEARFDACDQTLAEECALGSGIGELSVQVRNHVQRPDDFPIVATPDEPVYATITQRGDDFALQARFADLRRVSLIDNGSILGLETDIGDGSEPFAVALDIEGAPLGDDVEVSDTITLDDASQDLGAAASIANLPAHFELCMRTPNEALVVTGEDFTEICEEHPFVDEDGESLDGIEPMAIAYDLGNPAVVSGSFERRLFGTDEDLGTAYEAAIGGEVAVPNLPERMSTHVLLPPEGVEGPLHAVYNGADGIDEATIEIHSTVGEETVCMDPRDEAQAMCLEARIEALPRYLELRYDPTENDDNLLFKARRQPPGTPGIILPLLDRPDLRDIVLSSVAPDEVTGDQRALLLTGEIEDLPTTVHGTLALPETPEEPTAVQFCASIDPCGPDAAPGLPIGRIRIDARNIVVADPTPLADDDLSNDTPVQRAIEGGTLPEPTDLLVMYQRGEAFHARVDIGGIRGAGYRTTVAESGRPSGTQVLNLDLQTDPAPVLRAFVDLDEGTSHLIADATLSGIPPATVMCFRGADLDPDDDPAPEDSPFCETRPTNDEGAFELSTLPGEDTTGLDVDAFVRQSTGGEADVLASRVRITDIPALVRGTFPAQGAGSLDVRGYDADEQPRGFGEIDAEVATFDLRAGAAGDGYPADATPFTRSAPEDGARRAPAPAAGRQHLALVYSGDNLNARARVRGLQQLALRDGTCGDAAVDPGAVRFDTRADHPTYPEPPEGEHPYTCVRTVVDQGAGEPMDLHIRVDTSPPNTGRPQVLSLTHAELTAVPSAMELILADKPNVSATNIDRPVPCPTVGDGVEPDSNCQPAMIRFDQTGAGQILGELRVGDVIDLRSVDEIIPNGNEFDRAAFTGIHELPAAEGMRALVGMYAAEDEDSRFAAVGRFRFDVPGSLTVDAPDSASGDNYTDFRFHYAVREEDGDIVASLGDLLVLLEQADGEQILASGDGLHGAQIPGELALALYLRESISSGETLLQIDGVTSTELDLNAVMLTPHETGLDPEQAAVLGVDPTPLTDRKAFQLLGLAPGPFTDWDNPSFRFQVEILDNPYVPPGPYGPGTTDEDSCSAIDCEASYARVDEIRASVDLNPPNAAGNRTRLVRIAFDVRSSEKGGEIRAFDDVNAPLGAQGNAEISAQANISIEPMRLYVFKGIPFLGNLEVDIDLSIDLGFQLDRVRSFLFGNDGIHVEAQALGSGNASAIGPISIVPHTLFAGVQGPLNVTVAGIEYNGGFFGEDTEEPIELRFASCQSGDLLAGLTPIGIAEDRVNEFLDVVDLTGTNGVMLTEDTSVVVLPEIDGNFTKYGLGNLVSDLFEPIVDAIACAATDVDLRPLLDAQIPATPADAQIPGRPVPPEHVMDAQVVEPEPAPVAEDATLTGGAMCGLHEYRELHITGPVTVAGVAGPNCPSGSESTLSITAEEIYVDAGGSIDASAIVQGGCTAESINYRYPAGRSPLDSLFDCEDYLASNDGAPHAGVGGKGGLAGFLDPPPDAYSFSIFGITTGGLSEAGYRGGGGEGGGGGGVIGLSADRVILEGDLLANGGTGGDGGGGACAGSGGGSGGAVVIDAAYVRFDGGLVRANGGAGGNGGGGGSGGQVLLSAGVLANYSDGSSATVSSGAGSATADCIGEAPDNGFFGDPTVDEELDARSDLLALGEFWQTNTQPDGTNQPDDENFDRDFVGIDLPFRAAAADFGDPYGVANDLPYNLLLCDIFFETDSVDYEQGMARYFPSGDGDWREYPCGLSDPFLLGFLTPIAVLEENLQIPAGGEQILAGDMQFEDVTLGSGFHGLYTRAFVSLSAPNDCFEDDYYGDPANPTPVTDFLNVDGEPSAEEQAALIFDHTFCAPAESLPPAGEGSPELVIGVDDYRPNIELIPVLPNDQQVEADPPNFPNPTGYSSREVVRFNTLADDLRGNVRLSGLDSVVCFVEGSFGPEPDDVLDAVDCTGPDPWEVDLNELGNVVVVRATDKLGNWQETRWNITVDEVGPSVSITEIVSDPTTVRANGWFSEAPDYRIGDFEDGESHQHPGIFLEYRVDEGPIHDCPEDPAMPGTCLVDRDDLPVEGRHVLHAFGIDRAGNRTGTGSFTIDPDEDPEGGTTHVIRIDFSDPTSGAFVAPLTPSGTNGWWSNRPWLGVVGFDRPVGGSGFEPLPGEPVPNPEVAFLQYSVDGAAFEHWDDPFQLGDGDHTVCTIAKDLAGNPWTGPLEQVCTPEPILVDTRPPVVLINSVPGSPNGSGGWFTSVPGVTVTAFEPLLGPAGSGIDPLVEPSGLFVSIDGGHYDLTPAGSNLVLAEGEHVVRAYAVDVAGNRSAVVERIVDIDRSRPVSSLRTTPPAPAQNGWYRTAPTITLRATDGDENAGVDSILWCLGTGCTPTTVYTAPFTVPAGTTVVRWQARDVSGAANLEAVQQLTVKADTAPPTAKATLASPLIWSRTLANLGLGPTAVSLKWTVGDDRSGALKVTVVVFDVFGTAVRRLDAGTVVVPAGQTFNGTTQWNGKNDTLSGLVPIGVYHYRVIVTDEAGNVAESGESRTITIKLL